MSIQNARSNTSGNAPSSLKDGQIAINQADSVVYSRNVDGSIRRFLLPKRLGVANAAFQVRAFDTYIGIASLTASRTITLPAAANYPAGQPLTIADESGAVTASVTVGLAQASGSSDTINGATNLLFTTPYFGATLFSDGVSKWTAIGLAAGGSGSALLYTPQTLTAAQQRQTLANLALLKANFSMTEIQAAASKGSYLGLVDGLADGFADSSGIDTANAQNATVQNGTVVNQASDPTTKALLHFDGANGSTSFADASSHTFTPSGNAQISTAQSVFGGASGLFAASGDYITSTSSDYALTTGDFSYEFRVRFNTVGAAQFMVDGRDSSGANGLAIFLNTNKAIQVDFGATNITAGGTILAAATWYTVQVSRSGTSVRLFINGAVDATATSSASITSQQIRIGSDRSGASPLLGYVDELRLSNVARNTAAYTPASSAFVGGSSGVLTLPSVNYTLSSGVPTKGSIFIRAKATADAISPNTNFIASLSRNGTLGGANSLDVTLAATAVLPDGYTHYEANEVDLTGLTSGSILKGSLRTVGTSLGVAIKGWRIREA